MDNQNEPRYYERRRVYFARIKATGNIKIGCSGNVYRRLVTLQYEMGEMELLGLIPGGTGRESSTHKRFIEYALNDGSTRRNKKIGEVFRPGEKLLAFIESDQVNKEWCKEINKRLHNYRINRRGRIPLTEVRAIREGYAAGEGLEVLAERYRISSRHAGQIIEGRTYREAGGPTSPTVTY